MDLFFIILLFFLVITTGDEGLSVRPIEGQRDLVPRIGFGKAQILIQMVSYDSVLWIDNTSFYANDWDRSWESLRQDNVLKISQEAIDTRLKILRDSATCLSASLIAILRCPPDLDAGDIVNLQTKLDTAAAHILKSYAVNVCILEGLERDLGLESFRQLGKNRVNIKW